MSKGAPHDTADSGFLGHLIARNRPHVAQAPLPTLERRRPGLFEPRTRMPATALDTTLDKRETRVRPSLSSAASDGAPAMRHAEPASSTRIPAVSAPPPSPPRNRTGETSATTSAPPQPATATVRTEQAVVKAPALAMPTMPQTDRALSATRLPRRPDICDSSMRDRSSIAVAASSAVVSKASSPDAIVAPQTLSTRETQIVRVEQSQRESRTIIERERDKQRDMPSTADVAPRLNAPSRLTRSEASSAPVAHPARSAAMLAPAAAPPAPAPVHVSIGRVEIRSLTSAAAPAASRSTTSKPQLGLDEYLQQRHGSGR